MTTAINTVTAAIAVIATAAAIAGGMAYRTAAPTTKVAKLERVVVVGKRADATVVAQLPRVVIEGRRTVDVAMVAAKRVASAF